MSIETEKINGISKQPGLFDLSEYPITQKKDKNGNLKTVPQYKGVLWPELSPELIGCILGKDTVWINSLYQSLKDYPSLEYFMPFVNFRDLIIFSKNSILERKIIYSTKELNNKSNHSLKLNMDLKEEFKRSIDKSSIYSIFRRYFTQDDFGMLASLNKSCPIQILELYAKTNCYQNRDLELRLNLINQNKIIKLKDQITQPSENLNLMHFKDKKSYTKEEMINKIIYLRETCKNISKIINQHIKNLKLAGNYEVANKIYIPN